MDENQKSEASLYEEGVELKRAVVNDFLDRKLYVGKKTMAVIKSLGSKTYGGKVREFIVISVDNRDYQTDLSAKNKNWLIDTFGSRVAAYKGKVIHFVTVPTSFKQGETVKEGFELNMSL